LTVKELQKGTNPIAHGFSKRIGSTTYRVGVRFSETATETAKDKIARIIRVEMNSRKEAS
jgi:hypothetical protein